mgnify:CR=1 FL=1
MERYYHLYSSPLKNTPLFRKDEDKVYFLNRIAICRISFKFNVYAYVLMDNHVHFLVSGESSVILAAFNEIKRIFAKYLANTTGVVAIDIDDFSVSLRPINGEDDFKSVVAYILRNPLKAGLGSPMNYYWSSCFLYFNPWLRYFPVKTAKEYGAVKIRTNIKTRAALPDKYTFLDDMIFPGSWCLFKKVEQLFGRSVDLFCLLNIRTTEQDEEGKIEGVERNTYTDGQLMAKVDEYCKINGVDKISELTVTELRSLITLSHKRWGASKKQVKRILGASDSDINRFY